MSLSGMAPGPFLAGRRRFRWTQCKWLFKQ